MDQTLYTELYEDQQIVRQEEGELETLESVPTLEVVKCIKELKKLKSNRKRPNMYRAIKKILKTIWKNKKIPKDWKEDMIITIPKQEDMTKWVDHTAISILNVAYKILITIIRERLEQHSKNVFGYYQYGYRNRKLTVDTVHILRQITEEGYKHYIESHIVFIDFQ